MDKQTDEKEVIRVKRSRGYIPLFLMLSVVLLALSVYCVIYAYTEKLEGVSAAMFYVAGAIGILFFAYSTFDNLFQTIKPKNALIIGEEGFADFTIGGVGLGVIRWSEVKSVKTTRSKDGTLLTIELYDYDDVVSSAPNSVQRTIDRAKWAQNSIAIRQIDVAERLSGLIPVFNERMGKVRHQEQMQTAQKENSKTKVMTDDDVKSLLHAMGGQPEPENNPVDDGDEFESIFLDEEQLAASRVEKQNEKPVEKPIDKPLDELMETLVAIPTMPTENTNSDAKDGSESLDEDAKIYEVFDDEDDVTKPLPTQKPKANAEPKAEPKEEPVPVHKEQVRREVKKEESAATADASVSQSIDALITSVKSESKPRKDNDSFDELFGKFNDELKTGKKRLNDAERDELADELTALLADIRKKKNR